MLFLNALAILLSFVALAIAVTYPFTKRFFALPQAVPRRRFRLRHPDGLRGDPVAPAARVLGAARGQLFYAFAYDTEYAMVDRDDDARLGMRTSALTLGPLRRGAR